MEIPTRTRLNFPKTRSKHFPKNIHTTSSFCETLRKKSESKKFNNLINSLLSLYYLNWLKKNSIMKNEQYKTRFSIKILHIIVMYARKKLNLHPLCILKKVHLSSKRLFKWRATSAIHIFKLVA